MPDLARHQTPAYLATHYDPADPTLGAEPRTHVTPEFAQLCDDLLVAAGRKHRCGCGASFWSVRDRDGHEARCAA